MAGGISRGERGNGGGCSTHAAAVLFNSIKYIFTLRGREERKEEICDRPDINGVVKFNFLVFVV